MLKWQATLHTQENSEGLHDIHWRCELLSQGGAGSIHCLDVDKKSVIDSSGIEARQICRNGVSTAYVTSESSVLCLTGWN